MKDQREVILIFDIGKTNKKYYLFDDRFDVLDQGQIEFEEVTDDDGDPADDIEGIESWILQILEQILSNPDYRIIGINFTTYGASFIHLSDKGTRVGYLYNYTKEFPLNLYEKFKKQYDPNGDRILNSGSPGIGMLNSGFQLYWIKYHKPELYRKIRYSLHFPQYLSYLLTRIPVSEYTSLGCHTALWNYSLKEYDHWVKMEKIDKKLATLVPAFQSINCRVLAQKIKIGIGIHDSSAALLPYLNAISDPFILISTGTWSVSLNPFSDEPLDAQDIANGCLYYMRPDGKPVIAQRLFLGYEYEHQVRSLSNKYKVSAKKIRKIKYDAKVDKKIRRNAERYFQFTYLGENELGLPSPEIKLNLKKIYHQLMAELVDLQIRALEHIIKNARIKSIIIDGGFIKNEVFLKMLVARIPGLPIYSSKTPAGSALGAAIALMPECWSKKYFRKNYKLQRVII